MAKTHIIGIDLGGTNIKIGLLNLKAKIISKKSFETRNYKTRDALINKMVQEIRNLLAENNIDAKKVAGVGIGVPGLVDTAKGTVHYLVNIPGWIDVPLQNIIRRKLKIDCFVDNDVNVMALGELYFGAAKGAKNILCITLGTGVGGGIIIDGKLYRGSSFSAGEIGHVGINEEGTKCNCGNRGCVETYVGANYIIRNAVDRLKSGEKSILTKLAGGNLKNITPSLINDAAKKDDRFAKKIWQEAGTHLGSALAGVVNLLNPEKIIIGGGISKTGKDLYDAIRKRINEKAMKVPAKIVKIERSKLGYDAGLVGAATLVLVEKNLI